MITLVRLDSLAPHDFLKPANATLPEDAMPDRTAAILRIVKANPDGVTASDLAEALEVSPATVLKTLRELEREREVYSRVHGRGKTQIWYANGRLIHPYLEIFKEIRGKPYRLTIQESRTGPLVQIQERSFSLLHGERVEGAVFVEYAAVDQLIEALTELRTRFESHEKVKVKV